MPSRRDDTKEFLVEFEVNIPDRTREPEVMALSRNDHESS
jgi:hypothetical protein